MQEPRSVIVTGASRGLGAAVARRLAGVGVDVTISARSAKGLEAVAETLAALGGRCETVPADVADPDAGSRILSRALERFGRLDAVINNAGALGPLETLAHCDAAAWRYNLEVNLMGPVYLCMVALGELRARRGRIVNVSSGAAERVIQAGGAYCSAKAGLNHFTRVLAAEEPELTVLAVRPGVIDTEMQKTLRNLGAKTMPSQQARYYRQLKEKGELEPPDVPARSIAWLALHAPQRMSGQFLSYDDPAIRNPAQGFFGESAG